VASYNSPDIRVEAGVLNHISLADFTMQSNEVSTPTVVAFDVQNNPLNGRRLHFQILNIEPANMLVNTQLNEFTGVTDSMGNILLRLDPSDNANGIVQLVVTDLDRPNGVPQTVNIHILGYGAGPARALNPGDELIPLNSVYKLDLSHINANGGTLITEYSFDGVNYTPYNPAVGITGFDQLKHYTLYYRSAICYDPQYPNTGVCGTPLVKEFSTFNGANLVRLLTIAYDGKLSGFPSPFNPKKGTGFMTLTYGLPADSSVEINIYDLFGQPVWHRDIASGDVGGKASADGSANRVLWYGTNDNGVTVASGGYVVTVKVAATGQVMKSKVLVVK
jgi:hypothetical protein